LRSLQKRACFEQVRLPIQFLMKTQLIENLRELLKTQEIMSIRDAVR
jgi:hypothetical protein